MTISTTDSRISYNGNSVTTVFSFPYRFLANGDIVVVSVSSTGVETVKVLTTDYTVTGAGDDGGGSVTMIAAPATGTRLIIYRDTAITQETDYISGDPFPAETHERALDRLTMVAQELNDSDTRSLRLSTGTASSVDTELPAPEALKLIGWNADADGLENFDSLAGDVVVTSYMETVLAASTAAAARTTLGAAASGANTDITGLDMVNALAPATQTPSGAAGESADRLTVVRAGGYGSYGARLTTYKITDATPAGEFDVGDTSWVTQTNLTGGQVFGGWHGANTPAAALSQTYSGGAAIGQELNVGNRWADFGLQTAPGGTRYTTGQNIVPDVLPASDGVNSTNLTTITIASPGVFTWPSTHGFTAGMGIVFGGAGTLPTGLTAGTTYYILSSGLTATQFQVSATPGGTAVNTTGSFVAPIYGLPSWPGSFGQVIGKSVHGHRWWVGTSIPVDSIFPAGWAHYESGGSIAGQAPAGWAAITGHWGYGLDFGAGTFASAPINFSFANSHVNTATAGGQTLPANPQGFVKLTMSGSAIRIPYYNA